MTHERYLNMSSAPSSITFTDPREFRQDGLAGSVFNPEMGCGGPVTLKGLLAGRVGRPVMASQIFQKSLIKEYTLNHIMDPHVI